MIVRPLESGHFHRRKVTVITPGAEGLALVGLDVMPEQIGPNRSYKLAQLNPNDRIPLYLDPEQFMIGASSQGLTYCTIIIEHLAPGEQ